MSGSGGSDDLEALRPTERFTERVDDYRRWRPTYPEAALDAVLEGLGSPAALVAADVGAGTGIFARLLSGRGIRVVAVEPNASMREGADPDPRVEWHASRAEATGLPVGSVDLVTCAQAFHWFDADAALAEFRRILRPRGRVALLWNERDRRDPATRAFGDALRAGMVDDAAARVPFSADALREGRRFRDVDRIEARITQRLSAEGLLGRATSASYVAKAGPLLVALERALAKVHRRFAAPDGSVELVYTTTVWRATRADG